MLPTASCSSPDEWALLGGPEWNSGSPGIPGPPVFPGISGCFSLPSAFAQVTNSLTNSRRKIHSKIYNVIAEFFLHLVVWLLGRQLGSILWWVRLGQTHHRESILDTQNKGTFMGFLTISALGGPWPLSTSHRLLCIKPFFSFSFYLFQKGRKGEKEGEEHWCERNIDWLPLVCNLIGDQTRNPGPNWELNWRPFTLWDKTQPTEPHWSGLPDRYIFYIWRANTSTLNIFLRFY